MENDRDNSNERPTYENDKGELHCKKRSDSECGVWSCLALFLGGVCCVLGWVPVHQAAM